MKRTPITAAQIKKIHTTRRQAMDEDTYRDLLWNRFKASSTLDLTKFQAIKLIEILQGKENKKTYRRPQPEGMISNKQLVMLTDILAQCGKKGVEANLWVMRVFKNSHEPCNIFNLNQLTIQQATKVIPVARTMYKATFGVDHKPGVVLERRA